ncbi:hypothetical protein KXD93_22355 [Mucilaginibacter sp. BJC16-A38]|uniref:hypothetical protein n=1 Tax=Mucilaginibacter phenanthrenivorans TaxID=1234842 RepID=UPI002157DCD2|nr:hypothetical protein [Mucilaginibacter phenanthrenivorans]MCR8560413.1 hypothetical protein [Mucilaginibacter phenanthrenivorans]
MARRIVRNEMIMFLSGSPSSSAGVLFFGTGFMGIMDKAPNYQQDRKINLICPILINARQTHRIAAPILAKICQCFGEIKMSNKDNVKRETEICAANNLLFAKAISIISGLNQITPGEEANDGW